MFECAPATVLSPVIVGIRNRCILRRLLYSVWMLYSRPNYGHVGMLCALGFWHWRSLVFLFATFSGESGMLD